jgi:RHS repeat-associated protein
MSTSSKTFSILLVFLFCLALSGRADAQGVPEVYVEPFIQYNRVGVDWSTVPSIDSYRLQIKKTGEQWPTPSSTGPATALVPINAALPSSPSSWVWEVGATATGGDDIFQSTPTPGQQYTWRVRSAIGTTSSGWSAERTFTVPYPLPGSFTNVSPADGISYTYGTQPANLDWGSSTNITSYEIYLEQGDSSPDVLHATLGNSIWAVNGTLSPGTYYWKARAINPTGFTDGPTWSFTIQSLPAPGSFANQTPSDGQIYTGGSQPSLFDWDTSNHAASYDLYLDLNDSTPDTLRGSNLSFSEWTRNITLGKGRWYWRVVSKNSSGNYTGPTSSFVIAEALPAPMISVDSSSPTDLSDTTALVKWTWTGSTDNASSITVTVRDLLTNAVIVTDAGVSKTATSYLLTSLNSANQYRVNIAYQPQSGYSQGSNDLEFYTRFPAPLISNPNPGEYTGSPAQLGWQLHSGLWSMASRLHISTSSSGFSPQDGFASPLVNATPPTSAYSWNGGAVGQTYWWTVRQASSTGSGPPTSYFSTPQTFIYGPQPTNPPPTVNVGFSASSASGQVSVAFTPNDANDTQLRYDLHIYNAARDTRITGVTGISEPLGAIRGVAQNKTFTPTLINGALTNGTAYTVRIKVFDPAENAVEVFAPFIYSGGPSNAPPVITNLTVTASPGTVSVSFTPTDANGDQMRYDIQVYTGTGVGTYLGGLHHEPTVRDMNNVLQSYPNLQLTSISPPLVPGTVYGLRVKLFDSNNAEPSSFDEEGFTYQAEPTVTVTAVDLGPFTSVPAGSKIDVAYTILSNAPISVLTAAGLADTSHPTTLIGLPPAALIECALEANVPKAFTMQAIIPSNTPAGTYYIRSGLWFDRNNNDTIDSNLNVTPNDLPVVEAKTWPTAATTITVTAPVNPTLSIVAAQSQITESGSSGSFVIKREVTNGSMNIGSAVTAKVRIDTSEPKSATPSTSAAGFVPASADYILTRTSDNTVISTTANVVIPANQESVTLNVVPHDDTQAEGAELIRVLLDADSGYETGNTSAEIIIRETLVQTGALAASTTLWSGKKTGGAFVFPITVTTTPGSGNVPQLIRRIFLQTTSAPGFPSQVFAQAHLDSTQAAVDLRDLQWRTTNGVGQPLFLWSQLDVTPGANYQLQFSAEIAPAAGGSINDPLVYQLSDPFTVTYQNSFTGFIASSTTAPLFRSGETVGFTASSMGGSGTVTYQWYGSKVPEGITGPSLSFVLNYFGLTPVIARHADTANNVWWSQKFVSLARTSLLGDPSTDSSRRLAIQGVDTSPASGNLFLAFPDLSVPAIGVPFSLVRFYNSDGNTGDPEKGWSWNYTHASLSIDGFISQGQNGRTVTVDLGDRAKQEFVLDSDGTYVSHTPGNFSKLAELVVSTLGYEPGKFLLMEKNGLIYEFGFPDGDSRTPLTHYYAKRHLLSIKNHRGQGLTFAYEPIPGTTDQRRLDFVQDATGRFYDFHYDTSQRLQAVADFTNRGVIYQYPNSTTLRPDRFTDVRGKTTTYIYHIAGTSSAGRLHSIRQPKGNTPVAEISYYSSVANRRVAGIRDGRGNLTAFEYLTNATNVFMPDRDEDFRVEFSPTTKAITSLIESYGKPGQFTRTSDFKDAAAYRQTATAGLAEGSTQTVPGLLNAQGAPQSTQSTQASFDDYGTATSVTDSLGFSSQTIPITNPEKNLSLPQTVTDRRSKTWTYNWNTAFGELNSSTSPEGDSVSYTYWDNGLPKTVTDGETHTTQFFYTLHGYPDYIIDAAGKTIDFQADALGRITKVTDQETRSISYTHNAAGQVETVTLDGLTIAVGESKTLTMTYDDNGRLETRTDRRGAVTEFRYNEVNLTREIILPASTAAPGRRNILLGYDSMNRPSTLENLNGHTTSRTYDTRGRLHTIVNGLSQTVLTRTYYDNNLVKTETDGAGITTEYTWDANNRLVRKTGLGNLADTSDDVSVEFFPYDNEGQPLTIRDPRGNFTHLKYDNAGRRTQSVVVKQGQNTNRDAALADPANFHQHFTFDRNSQMKSFTDPMGHTTNFFYDVMKRLDHYTDAANRTWDYTYYDNGLPHTITTPDTRTTTYTFDAANRLDYIQYHEAQVFADFGYDANGNQTSLQDQYGTTSSAFDSRNQMISSTDSFGQTVGYDYFPGGNLKNLTYPGNHVVAYTWDAAERMKTVTPWVGGTWTYNYRANSQLDLITNNNGTLTDYGYDALGRLNDLWHKTSGGTLIARQQFSQFDKAGNPEVETYTTAPGFPAIPAPPVITAATYDPANRLQTVNGAAATVDGGGRTLATPAPTAGTFTWEGPDWLKTFTQGSNTQSYKVSGTGDRIERSVSAPNAQTTRYTLEHSGALANVLAETDAANAPRRYYIHGLGLLASIDASNSSVSSYHFDHRGDTLALTSASQTVTDSYAYSVFGTHVANGSTANPFRFAGQVGIQTDSPELLHMRARYYQPTVGRFISQDPSGFEDGMNVFSYVGGRTINRSDPTGRFGEEPLERVFLNNASGPYSSTKRGYDTWLNQRNGIKADWISTSVTVLDYAEGYTSAGYNSLTALSKLDLRRNNLTPTSLIKGARITTGGKTLSKVMKIAPLATEAISFANDLRSNSAGRSATNAAVNFVFATPCMVLGGAGVLNSVHSGNWSQGFTACDAIVAEQQDRAWEIANGRTRSINAQKNDYYDARGRAEQEFRELQDAGFDPDPELFFSDLPPEPMTRD